MSTSHESYKGLQYMWRQVDIIYDLILDVFLCRIFHVCNGGICGTEHVLCKFILNKYKPQ